MEWLLLAGTLAVFGFGYWVLSRLGRLLDNRKPVLSGQGDILLFGSSDYELAAETALRERELPFQRAATARELLDGKQCRYLLALSDCEVDNLVACEIGALNASVPTCIAICRSGPMEPEFERREIRHFTPELMPPENLAAMLQKNVKR